MTEAGPGENKPNAAVPNKGSAAPVLSPQNGEPGLQRRRTNPLGELIATEARYVQEMSLAVRRVAAAWSITNFPPKEVDAMFRAIEVVYRINSDFLRSLQEIGPNPTSPKGLGNLLMHWVDKLQAPYTSYVSVYMCGLNSWAPIIHNKELGLILAQISTELPKSVEQPEWTLDDFFELPLIRLRFYKKLYNRLLRSTQAGRSDHELLVGANRKLDVLVDKAAKRQAVSFIQQNPNHAPKDISTEKPISRSNTTASASSVAAMASHASPTVPSPRPIPAPTLTSPMAKEGVASSPHITTPQSPTATTSPLMMAQTPRPPSVPLESATKSPEVPRPNATSPVMTPTFPTMRPVVMPPPGSTPRPAPPASVPMPPQGLTSGPRPVASSMPTPGAISGPTQVSAPSVSPPMASPTMPGRPPAPMMTPGAMPALGSPLPVTMKPPMHGRPVAGANATPLLETPANFGVSATSSQPRRPIPTPAPSADAPRNVSGQKSDAANTPNQSPVPDTKEPEVITVSPSTSKLSPMLVPPAMMPVPVPSSTSSPTMTPKPKAEPSHTRPSITQSIESQNLVQIQNRIDSTKTIDVFSLEPKSCRLHMTPPSLPFQRQLRSTDSVRLQVVPRHGAGRTIEKARLILLTDLLLVAEDKAPHAMELPAQDIQLMFPPLSGRFIDVYDQGVTQPTSLRLSIMQRVDLLVTLPTAERKALWLRELHACKNFGQHQQRSPVKESRPLPGGMTQPAPVPTPTMSGILSTPKAGPPSQAPNTGSQPKSPPAAVNAALQSALSLSASPPRPTQTSPPAHTSPRFGAASVPVPMPGTTPGPQSPPSGQAVLPSTLNKGPSVPPSPMMPPDRLLPGRSASPANTTSDSRIRAGLPPLLVPNASTSDSLPSVPVAEQDSGRVSSPITPAHLTRASSLASQESFPRLMTRRVDSPDSSMPMPPNRGPDEKGVVGAPRPGATSAMSFGSASEQTLAGFQPPSSPNGPLGFNIRAPLGGLRALGMRRPSEPQLSQLAQSQASSPTLPQAQTRTQAGPTAVTFSPNTAQGPGPAPGKTIPRSVSTSRLRDASSPTFEPPSKMRHETQRRNSTEWMQEDQAEQEIAPAKYEKQSFNLCAQMRCKVFLKQSYAQWRSLGSARLRLYHLMPSKTNQLVVENDKKVMISSIVLPNAVERVGKTGLAVELSDMGRLTGIVYMLHMRSEESANGLFEQLLTGSSRTALTSPSLA